MHKTHPDMIFETAPFNGARNVLQNNMKGQFFFTVYTAIK